MTPHALRVGRRIAPLLVAVSIALAGCDDPASSVAPTPTRTPEPTPTRTVYQLGTVVWYEGLTIEIESVTATLDQRGGPVDVRLRLDNPTDADSTLDAVPTLLVGTLRAEPTRESTIPAVPAKGSANATLTYELQGITSIGAAVLEIGAGPRHVARVPITPFAGSLVSLEPVELALAGSAAAGTLRITLRSGVLRWDLPDWSQELGADLQALTLTYDAAYTGAFAGGFAFTADNVALKLPNGKVVAPRRDGHSQSVELIGAKKTKKGLFSRFEIPAGLTGQFSLLVRNGTEKAITFTIG